MVDANELEHLQALREEAQRAYAWSEYVEDHDIEEREPGEARRTYEDAMVALHGALEREGLELTEDLDSPDWFQPLDGQDWPSQRDEPGGLER